jgi:hypothetical protein
MPDCAGSALTDQRISAHTPLASSTAMCSFCAATATQRGLHWPLPGPEAAQAAALPPPLGRHLLHHGRDVSHQWWCQWLQRSQRLCWQRSQRLRRRWWCSGACSSSSGSSGGRGEGVGCDADSSAWDGNVRKRCRLACASLPATAHGVLVCARIAWRQLQRRQLQRRQAQL